MLGPKQYNKSPLTFIAQIKKSILKKTHSSEYIPKKMKGLGKFIIVIKIKMIKNIKSIEMKQKNKIK